MATIFQAVLPSSQKASYNPGDLLSFRLQTPALVGYGIVPGSLRLSGTLTVGVAGTPLTRLANTDRVYWDAVCGMHGVINQLSVSGDRVGTIESISDYARCVATLRNAEMGTVQSTLDSMRALELAMPDNYATQPVAFGQAAGQFATPTAIRPLCCLNNASDVIPFDKTGNLEINIITNQALTFLHGTDVAGKSYSLADIQVSYFIAPVKAGKVQLSKLECLYRTMPSSSASFQTRSSMVVSRLLMSFIPTTNLTNPVNNSLQCVNANIQRMVLTYGDGQSLVTTSFNNTQEIASAGLFAVRVGTDFASSNGTVVSLQAPYTSAAANGYVIGSAFPGGVDVRQTTLGIQLEGIGTSLDPNAAAGTYDGLPYSGYIVLQGAIEL